MKRCIEWEHNALSVAWQCELVGLARSTCYFRALGESAENLALIREEHGVDLFDAAIQAGRGVIVAAPHYGNWELLNQWLAAHTPLAILYAPPESAIGDAFLRQVRADDANASRVTQVRAEGPGVRQLFKLLKDGGVVGILPDQQPKQGDGEFAPFFGVPALTMTLLGRWNWWAPGPLRRLHNRFGLRESSAPDAHAEPALAQPSVG